MIKKLLKYVFLCTTVLLLGACSATKYVPDGKYLLNRVKLVSDNDSVEVSSLSAYVRQHPNSKWFSLTRIPLYTYNLSGADTTKWFNRITRSLGEAPVILDSAIVNRTCGDLRTALYNRGYLNAQVTTDLQVHRKLASVTYRLHTGDAYRFGHVVYDICDTAINALLKKDSIKVFMLHAGQRFDINALDLQRKSITTYLLDRGYYRFHKDFIRYEADTVANSKNIDVTLVLSLYRANNDAAEEAHKCFVVDSVRFTSLQPKLHLRHSVLRSNTEIQAGQPFSSTALQHTYNNFGALSAIRYTNILWHEHPDSALLDCDVQIATNKPSTIIFQPEGTNTAGDFGAAASLTYQNRNLFRGSELFSVEVRGAYEAITGLKGYNDQDYIEYSTEAKLSFPRLLAPLLPEKFHRVFRGTSELSLMYDSQDRPEFHRRVLSAAWRYKWNNKGGRGRYNFDLLDLNYVFMPWISDTFRKEYLDSVSSRNAILRYNYENLFIMKIGLGYSYNGGNYSLRVSGETAGNLLHGMSALFGQGKNDLGQYTLFSIAYAQYVKGDFSFTTTSSLNTMNSVVFHFGLGIAYPYGNSNILPYEKRYFSGGANSVRGWGVRELGPGSYSGNNGAIDFINQTGDIRMDINLEYRTHLFWKLNGALFVDGGNIWTIRNYEDQPGGQFKFDKFYKQIAVSYGAGLRFNFDYFILRFDLGMKAINPAYDDSYHHYCIVHPRFSRDSAFHFAVGLPF